MPTIPKLPDIVFIAWQKNPLHPNSPRTIEKFSIVGSAKPCRQFLMVGERALPAVRCLLRNGFTISCNKQTTGVTGFIVLVRK